MQRRYEVGPWRDREGRDGWDVNERCSVLKDRGQIGPGKQAREAVIKVRGWGYNVGCMAKRECSRHSHYICLEMKNSIIILPPFKFWLLVQTFLLVVSGQKRGVLGWV